jgi:hypothetical protein
MVESYGAFLRTVSEKKGSQQQACDPWEKAARGSPCFFAKVLMRKRDQDFFQVTNALSWVGNPSLSTEPPKSVVSVLPSVKAICLKVAALAA